MHPDAAEACDPGDVDEDCSGDADDLDPAPIGTVDWYVDVDGDGFGAGEPAPRCDGLDGEVRVAGDCDDDAAADRRWGGRG